MKLAKIFRHGGSQAVRLPKAFRFEGTTVGIERQGQAILLIPQPASPFKTLGEIARHFSARRSAVPAIEAPPRPSKHERPAPSW